MTRGFVLEYVKKFLRGVCVVNSALESNGVVSLIGTHNGSFHCDEAMACALLRCTSEFNDATILRTRDPKLLDQCNVIVDVGGVYDPVKLCFDHHQPSFNDTMTTPKATYHTRMSSAGLIYKHFGRLIIQNYVEAALASPYREKLLCATGWGSEKGKLSEQELDTLVDVIYKNFVEHIDGVDNGVNAYGLVKENEEEKKKTSSAATASPSSSFLCVRKYNVTTSLPERISRLLPWWNEEGSDKVEYENAAFLQAVELSATEFFDSVHYHAFAWMPARAVVEEAFLSASTVHPSGRIIAFKGRHCPWKDHLLELELEHRKAGQVLYVLFADAGGNSWRVQAVPVEAAGFECRRPLPWRGARDAELCEMSGIEGGIFVHVSGFIGGNRTYEGALRMAIKALEI